MKFDDDIWPSVQLHPWKARPRYGGPITLIELHATRSGIAGRTATEEYYATINWFKSPNNINEATTRPWASMSSVIIGGGRICSVMPDHYWPSFSLGHADPYAISIEIGQATNDTPYDPRDLDLAARFCAEKSAQYGIPVVVLPFLSADNHEAPGYVRHDRSANGGYYGKSDPGRLFDDRHFERKVLGYMAPPAPALGGADMALGFIIVDPQNGTGYWFTNGFVRRHSDSPAERAEWARVMGVPATPVPIAAKFLLELPEVQAG